MMLDRAEQADQSTEQDVVNQVIEAMRAGVQSGDAPVDFMQQLILRLCSDPTQAAPWDRALVALIVVSYVQRQDLAVDQVPALIGAVRRALCDPAGFSEPTILRETGAILQPAVPITASVTDHFIICLEDGRPCKSLKRHLRRHYAMTPDMYRARWGLPEDYPMVARHFSQRRAEIARQNKLGRYARRSA